MARVFVTLYNFNNFITPPFVKKGVRLTPNVNEAYRVRNELKVTLVCKEETCNRGHLTINENKDPTRLSHSFPKPYGTLGSICTTTTIYTITTLVVIKKTNCYFKHLLTTLSIMCEVRTFASNFDITTFIPPFPALGAENRVVTGTKTRGTIE